MTPWYCGGRVIFCLFSVRIQRKRRKYNMPNIDPIEVMSNAPVDLSRTRIWLSACHYYRLHAVYQTYVLSHATRQFDFPTLGLFTFTDSGAAVCIYNLISRATCILITVLLIFIHIPANTLSPHIHILQNKMYLKYYQADQWRSCHLNYSRTELVL